MIYILPLCIFTIFGALSACRTSHSNSELNRVQYRDAQANQVGAGKPFANWTEARLQALADYGRNLLSATKDPDDIQNVSNDRVREMYNIARNDSAAFAKLSLDKLADQYTITPYRGSLCFSEGDGGRHDLYYDGGADSWFVDRLTGPRKQVEAIAEFIGEYHALMGGKNNGIAIIQRVEFCPDSIWQYKMAYKGGVLYIGIPHHSLGFGFYNSQEIMRMWDSGEFLKSTLPSDVAREAGPKVGILWTLINPIGSFRISMRRGLLDRAKDLAAKIRGWMANGVANNLVEQLQGSVYPQVISQEVKAQLLELTNQGRLPALFANWQCASQLPEVYNQVTAIAQATICKAKNKNTTVKYDLKASLVNVANFHQIDVCAAFQIGSFDDRFLNPEPLQVTRESESFRYEVSAVGAVNVVTGDLVNVTALMDIGRHATSKTYESLSFHRALTGTVANQDLCAAEK